MSRMKTFSEEMAKYGETYMFSKDDAGASLMTPADVQEFDIRKQDDLDDLVDILHPQESLPLPLHDGIKAWLLEVFESNRGFEMGTFNASILATVMKKQSSKWQDISLGFVSDAIVITHKFINSALEAICTDEDVRDALASKLSDQLSVRYRNAIASVEFLLKVEKSNVPMTLNHYFNDNLQKR